jgi:hypothetical protein
MLIRLLIRKVSILEVKLRMAKRLGKARAITSFILLFIKHKIHLLKWKNSPLFINFILLKTNAILYIT